MPNRSAPFIFCYQHMLVNWFCPFSDDKIPPQNARHHQSNVNTAPYPNASPMILTERNLRTADKTEYWSQFNWLLEELIPTK